jgi:DNA polymerase III epsilon subunit family exonuclease
VAFSRPLSHRNQPAAETNDTHVGDGSSPRYEFLISRAIEFIGAHDNAVDEDRLIAHVFGGGPAQLWRSLLRSILATEERVSLRPDGRWALPRHSEDAQRHVLLDSFVAVDVETTGLRPATNRIIEIGLVRYEQGQAVDRFSTLINPERGVSAFISRLTGITNDMLVDAPCFADRAAEVVDFIESRPLLGHNIGFDVGFLNAEFGRVGSPALINSRIDTMGLAMRLIPGLRKPSLDNLARTLGLQREGKHRALGDAELAAKAALLLARQAEGEGIVDPDQFAALSQPPERRPRDHVGRARSVLDRSILANIPRLPGVYVMRDASDRVIYVGKAKSLRDRVGSYYSQALGQGRKLDGLIESLVKIDIEVTGTELEALLLESQLIRRYQPRFNTAMRSKQDYPFIKIDLSNPWPRVTLAKDRRGDDSRYFGPFKSRHAAKAVVDLINAHYPLRTCPRSFRTPKSYGSPCLRLDLKQCAGPCVGKADRDAYMDAVREVVRFLDGDDASLSARIWTELETAATRLDYERARQLRSNLQQLEQVVASQQAIREATDRHTLVLVLPSPVEAARELFLMDRGRLWARFQVSQHDSSEEIGLRLARAWTRLHASAGVEIDQDSLDESHIMNRWLARNWTHPCVIPFDREADIDWPELASWALRIAAEDLRRAGDARAAYAIDSGEGDVLQPDAEAISENAE